MENVVNCRYGWLILCLIFGTDGSGPCFEDTAGQERFHALGPIYYRDSQGAVLVYDITDADSFTKVRWCRAGWRGRSGKSRVQVRSWVRELRKMLGDGVQLVVAGNKSDLERERRVSAEEAQRFCLEVGAEHFLTSAKSNLGVGQLFSALAASARLGCSRFHLFPSHSVSFRNAGPAREECAAAARTVGEAQSQHASGRQGYRGGGPQVVLSMTLPPALSAPVLYSSLF